MSTRERPPQWPYHVGLFILCAFLVSAIMVFRVNAHKSTVTAPHQTPKPPTPIVIPTVRSSDLQVILSENEMYCKQEGKVDYSIFQLTPSGGSLPYKVSINNSLFEELSSFYIYKQNNPFRIQVYGGETIVVKLWSAGSAEPDWESAITIQVADPYCAHAPTLTLTFTPIAMFPTTSTLTSTITPTVRSVTNYPTRTKRPNTGITLTSTALTVEASSPTVTSTLNPKATTTNIPPQTSTSASTPTKGSGPTSTSAPTATKIPEPTNTRFVPTATSQPQPTITNTVIVIPRLKDCEDGIDNDGDGFIDFPNDPQCSDKNDNREDK